jgi:4-aminobutyrate aminotransferase
MESAQQIRELTHKYGILMVADEIQCGFGRTGRWFGFDHLGVMPDVVVFGKAVGGGLPLAGLAAPGTLMARWSPGEHGTTFGGNPIACAAGLAALRHIERNNLVERAMVLGERTKARLCPLVGHNGVYDVRGNGMMIGIELRDAGGRPDYERVGAVKRECRAQGLLLLSCGARIDVPEVDNSTIRLLPPLNITIEDLDRGLEILAQALSSAPLRL